MAIKLSQKEMEAWRARLVDPLLRGTGGVDDSSGKAERKPHRAPKVAKRVSVGSGPEGRGRLRRDDQGHVQGVYLELDLLPVPKERPRVVRTASGKSTSFTPARTKRFTNDVRLVIDAVMAGNPPVSGPVSLKMLFKMQIPASWPLWKKQAAREGRIAPTSRPDMDNLEKSLLDALNERAFTDDAFVIDRVASKRYADTPGIIITIDSLNVAPLTAKRADMDGLSRLPSVFFNDGESDVPSDHG